MKTDEVRALISRMENELQTLKRWVSENEASSIVEESITEEPKVEEEEKELLPPPPKEVCVKLSKKERKPSQDEILGCKIITSLPDFYQGECRLLKIHKRFFDNGEPKVFLDKYHVVVEAYSSEMQLLGSITTHWNNLGKFQMELIKRGINTHNKITWVPTTVLIDFDL